jgi:hypothetical protein
LIVLRAIAWAGGENPALLESLATPGRETQSNARKN